MQRPLRAMSEPAAAQWVNLFHIFHQAAEKECREGTGYLALLSLVEESQ